MVWFFGICLGLMVGIEMAPSNWGSLYFQDMYGLDPRTSGGSFVSNFFILFTLSRLLSGFIIEKIGYIKSLIVSAAAIEIIFVISFLSGKNGIYIMPALGFFVAIFWPTLMAVAIGYFGKTAPLMTGAIIAISGLVNVTIQYLIGIINRYTGPGWGYRSCIIIVIILLALLVKLIRIFRKEQIVQK